MKKNYNKPEFKIIKLDGADVIQTSGEYQMKTMINGKDAMNYGSNKARIFGE